MTRACPNCNTEVAAGANFCPACGQDMNVVVPQDQRIPTEDTGVPPPPTPQGQGPRGRSGFQIALIGCGGILGLIVLLGILSALVGNRDTADVQKAEEKPQEQEKKEEKKEKEPAKEKKEKEPAREPAAINLSGFGQAATESFNLEGGLAIFRLTHQGGGHFSGTLLDQNGQPGYTAYL